MTEKILTLSIASLIGGLFFYLRLPIPFMLGGIIAAAGVKFFLWPEIHWPARWRNLGLLVAGYGIGRNFTNETFFTMLKKVSPYWQIDGTMPVDEKEVLLGYEIARKFKAKPGSRVILATGDGKWESPFIVSGIVRTGGKEEQFAYMKLKALQEITGKEESVSLVQISVVADKADLESFVRRMTVENTGIRPQAIQQLAHSEQTVLAKLQALVLLVTIVVLLLTLVCVGTTMTEVVSERRKEIGLKKALGADNFHIAVEFFGESCMLGLIGGIIGSGAGYLFARMVGLRVFGQSLPLSAPIAIMAVVLSIVVTSAATMLPVRTAAQVDPAIVMRGE